MSKDQTIRPDGRLNDQLRPIKLEPNIAPNADGSVLVSFGDTRVICAATFEKKVPGWMRAQSRWWLDDSRIFDASLQHTRAKNSR